MSKHKIRNRIFVTKKYPNLFNRGQITINILCCLTDFAELKIERQICAD